MFVRLIPRVCRSKAICHPRWMSSRRNVPMFWHRGTVGEPWDRLRNHTFFDRPVDSVFRDMGRMMDSLMHRPFFEENYVRPKDVAEAWMKSEVAEVKYDKNKFEVKLDVSLYGQDELNISISDDRLIIKGKHEQKADNHGYVAREFTREFVIPENIDQESITSTLSDEGMLLIQGRVKGAEEAKERVINIERQKKEESKEES